ncbi:hypothetical protein [Dictyobacter kobayashii]|uniref:DUF4358 domain-containing protein n=1 Tax=Dictyobacter kobayashii TaxID=2014872 RepID=A0A402ABM4_9CHLR|nr:hypothetical protein [Dictyobacter kobayashii]GCE16500.1 hypothetical protein KDK_03000 [Dictyobacter kobayashii]
MPKSILWLRTCILLLCLILIGCGNAQTNTTQEKLEKNALNYASFVKKLQAVGVSGTKADAQNSDFFSGTPYGLLIKGERVSIFEYLTSEDAQNEAKRISSQGDIIQKSSSGSAVIDWVAPPHFYRSGRLIVLYVGNKQPVISLLQSILGPQFAGGV